MGKQINCPECMTLRGDTIAMEAEDQGWFKCPACGGEYWPKDDEVVTKLILKKQQVNNTYISLSQQPGVHIEGGGGSTGKVKKAGKKKTVQQLYQGLYKET